MYRKIITLVLLLLLVACASSPKEIREILVRENTSVIKEQSASFLKKAIRVESIDGINPLYSEKFAIPEMEGLFTPTAYQVNAGRHNLVINIRLLNGNVVAAKLVGEFKPPKTCIVNFNFLPGHIYKIVGFWRLNGSHEINIIDETSTSSYECVKEN